MLMGCLLHVLRVPCCCVLATFFFSHLQNSLPIVDSVWSLAVVEHILQGTHQSASEMRPATASVAVDQCCMGRAHNFNKVAAWASIGPATTARTKRTKMSRPKKEVLVKFAWVFWGKGSTALGLRQMGSLGLLKGERVGLSVRY